MITRENLRTRNKKRALFTTLILSLFLVQTLAFAAIHTKFGVYWVTSSIYPNTTWGNRTATTQYTNYSFSHTGWARVGNAYNGGGNSWVTPKKTSVTWVKGAWNGAYNGGPIAPGGKV